MKSSHPIGFVLFGSALILGSLGCTGGTAQGDVKASDVQAMGDISKSAKAVDGNYDKLSDAEKQQVLKMAGGNVATARREVMFMVHPPNEGNKGRMGPPKGP